MDLVPVKVKIGTNPLTGGALYPNFNLVSPGLRKGMDWSKYIDVYGDGWKYDKCCGHKTETPESPRGEQWGVLLVPKDFAADILMRFPNECSKITEVELEDFFNNHAHKHMPEEYLDEDILTGIKLKQDLGLQLSAQQLSALDPTTDDRGIRKNKNKYWADYKIKRGINVIQ